MSIITETALESNKKIRVNFDGGNLSSDGGLLLLKEFYHKVSVNSLFKKYFRMNDRAAFRFHKNHEKLLQLQYQITGAYFQDNHADILRNDLIINAAVEKVSLNSQTYFISFS